MHAHVALNAWQVGDPFFDEASAIVRYEWAVGTLRDPVSKLRLDPNRLLYLDDVMPFQSIVAPQACRPCLAEKPCDQGECDPTCVSNETVAVTVSNTSLSLPSGGWFARCRWVRLGGTCLSVCPADTTYMDPEDSLCKPCHQQCAGGCLGPLPSDCRRCANVIQNGVCVPSCDVGFFDNGDGLCQPCNSQCLLSPVAGCRGPRAADCHLCQTVSAVVDGVRTCVSSCPPLHYAQSVFNSTLSSAVNSTETVRIQGLDYCVPCDASCGSACAGPNATDCLDCKFVRNVTMTVEQWIAQGESSATYVALVLNNPPRACIDECPINTYLDSGAVCRPCHDSCSRGCLGPTSSDCLFCPRFTDSDTRSCVDYCAEHQYAVPSGACYNCSSSLCAAVGPAASPPASFFVNPYGSLQLNVSLLTVDAATNLSFFGGTGCKKVVRLPSGGLEDATFVNISGMSPAIESAAFAIGSPDGGTLTTTKYRLRVTAQDGVSFTEYIVRAVRRPPSNVSVLDEAALLWQGQPVPLSPVFSPTIQTYTATVAASATVLQFVGATATFASIAAASTLGSQTAVQRGTFNLTLPAGAPGSLTVTVVSESGLATRTYTIILTRRAPSPTALLSSLVVAAADGAGSTGVKLEPEFSPSVTAYTASVSFRTRQVSTQAVLAERLLSSVSVNSVQVMAASGWSSPLNFSTNPVLTIVVSSELGLVTTTYTVTLTRLPRSRNALLGSFSLTSPSGLLLDPSFRPSVFAYSAVAIFSERTFTLASVTPADAGATVRATVDGNVIAINSSFTGSLLQLTVTSEDATVVNTTNITLRNLPAASVNTLASASFTSRAVPLTLTCGALNIFVADETLCSLQVPATTTQISMSTAVTSPFSSLNVFVEGTLLTPTSQKSVSSLSVSFPLAFSSLNIVVNVTAENGAVQQYVFAATRAPLSSDPFLRSVASTVGALSPALSSDVTSYELRAEPEDSAFSFTATALYSASNVTVGYLVNRDNQSATVQSNCFSRAVTLAQCPGDVCVMTTTITTDQAGVFGFLGYTTQPRVIRNQTVIANRTSQRQCTLTTLTSTFTTFVSVSNLASTTLATDFDTVAIGVRVISTAEDRTTQYFAAFSVIRQASADTSFASASATFLAQGGGQHDTVVVFDGNNTAQLDARTASVAFADETVVLQLRTEARSARFIAVYRPSRTNLTLVRVHNATRSDELRFPLEVGTQPNTVVITVTAPNGVTVRNYTIVIRRPPPSTVSSLAGLELRSPATYSLTPLFNPLFREYEINVPFTLDTFSLLPLLADRTASIQFGRDTTPDGPPQPLSAAQGELFVGFCVVSGGFGYVSGNTSIGARLNRQRTGTWPLDAMLAESGIALTNGFRGSPAAPAPVPRCAGAPTLCAQCQGAVSPSGRCLSACPSRTFANALGACVPCHASCARDCVGSGPANCTLNCQNVSSVTLSGTIQTSLRCTRCLSVMHQGQCLLGACPTGLYSDDNATCQACHVECDGGCTGPRADQCTRCANVLHASANGTLGDAYCAPRCDAMYYQNSQSTCLPCNTQCRTGCNGGGADQCHPPATIVANISRFGCNNFSLNGTCVTVCPRGTYADPPTRVCESCHPGCANNGCTGSSLRECIKLADKSVEKIIPGAIQDTFFVPGTYFVSIRATDAANNVVYATSTGVIVDYTPPELTRDVFHADPNRDPENPEAVLFMANNESMSIGWDFQDIESDISAFEYCVGTGNTTCDLINWTSSGRDELDSLVKFVTVTLPMAAGQTYYARVRAYNFAGLNTTASSKGVTIDLTPPQPGLLGFADQPSSISNGIVFFADETTMAINWSSFADPESGIGAYGALPLARAYIYIYVCVCVCVRVCVVLICACVWVYALLAPIVSA
jgi:hypothetical protein